MIKELSNNMFSLSITTHPPECRYGDEPFLDSVGATSHLTETIEYHDKDVLNWIYENDLKWVMNRRGKKLVFITFETIEDATAFKLRWL